MDENRGTLMPSHMEFETFWPQETQMAECVRSVQVKPISNRTVSRELSGINLFMITLNATVGAGLYARGGQVLELGGPLSVFLSFIFVGFIAWAVMQCITEMLCIWPVPGAFSVYVSEFVDDELGIVVGVAYWYTYSVGFAALVSALATETRFSIDQNENMNKDIFDGIILYTIFPLIMVLINCLGVKLYGRVEVIFGTVKILCYFFMVFVLIAIYIEVWNDPLAFDTAASGGWTRAFLMCISISSFAYVGVEIVAASALEAKPRPISQAETPIVPSSMRRTPLISRTVKFSSVYMSFIVTIAYTLAGILITFGMNRDDCTLPRLNWVTTNCNSADNHGSVFTEIVGRTIPQMDHAFNAFVVFSIFTCASTNLYVASRSLYGLITSRLQGRSKHNAILRSLDWLTQTNRQKVPIRAMVVSAVAFWWVPFLGLIIDTLSNMGSVGVHVVWACECLAYIRYYHCISKHREYLERENISQVRRWTSVNDDYPYRSHCQPVLAYLGLIGCLFFLIISNSASLWDSEFRTEPFLSSFLAPISFVIAWVALKLFRGARWSLVDLNSEKRVAGKIKKLHDIRLGTL